MFPEDRVLVGVVNRKRDLEIIQKERWYRIPQIRMLNGVNAEYIAFFLSKAFGEKNGAVHCFAERQGLELLYRRDLLPREPNHPRANEVYYKVQLGLIQEKSPPILNPTRRSISFVYTTWDRFTQAHQISDLYSTADYFVDRIYHALRSAGVPADRTWSAEYHDRRPPQIRVLCQDGPFVASPDPSHGGYFLDGQQPEDEILAGILKRIAEQGGPVYLSIPADYL